MGALSSESGVCISSAICIGDGGAGGGRAGRKRAGEHRG